MNFLILILLSRIDISMPSHLNTNSQLPTFNSPEIDVRRYILPRHRFNPRINRGYYNTDRYLRKSERYLHPHRYWYIHSSRKQNPVFNKRLSIERRDKNPMLLKSKKVLPESNPDFLFKMQKLRKSLKDRLPDTLNEFFNAGYLSEKSGTKENSLSSSVEPKISVNDNRGMSDIFNSGIKKDNTSTDSVNQRSREVKKTKRASLSPSKRLYQSLGRFDLLYILGLFLIFIVVSSCVIVILPLASFCRNAFRRIPRKRVAKEGSNEIIVETVLANEQPSNAKVEAKSESLKEMYRKFVTNEIDGDGDTVGKRMKLERWMTQDFQHRSRSRPRFQRHFNSPDMEKVDEEHSEVEEPIPVPAKTGLNPYDEDSQSGSEDLTEKSNTDVNDGTEKRGKSLTKAKMKASKQVSKPFQLAQNKCVTIGRVHNPRYTNPRHMFSLVDNSKRLPRSSYSMLDILPKHFLK